MLKRQLNNSKVSNEWFFGNSDKVIYNNAGMSSSVYDKLDNYGKLKVAFKALDTVKYKRDYKTVNEIKIKIFELIEKEGTQVQEGNVTRVNKDLVSFVIGGQQADKRYLLFEKGNPRIFGENVKPFKEFKDIQKAVLKGDHKWLLNYANSLYSIWGSDMRQALSTNPTAQGVNEVFYKHLSPFIVMDFIFDGFYWRMGVALETIKLNLIDFELKPMTHIDFVVGIIPEFVIEATEYLKLIK